MAAETRIARYFLPASDAGDGYHSVTVAPSICDAQLCPTFQIAPSSLQYLTLRLGCHSKAVMSGVEAFNTLRVVSRAIQQCISVH